MEEIERLTEELLQAVLNSDIYREYAEQEEKLSAVPELQHQVNMFRADNFLMQQDNPDDLFAVSGIIEEKSAELRKIPEANAYLEAELAMNKMMQRICGKLFAGIDFKVPDQVF